MLERRRERDRPKAAPDSLYNPNKRVLLSYESDEHEERDAVVEQQDGIGDITIPDAATANYKIEEYPDEEEAEDGASSDKSLDDEDVEIVVGNDDTPRKNEDTLWTRAGLRKDYTTGQWPALGPLSYQWGDGEEEEEYDSTEEEAMQYLRAVR